ncbi:MAG: radical SAM protein [Promethearchaeota archaeon]
MGRCVICNKTHPLISNFLGICKECLVSEDPEKIKPVVDARHQEGRSKTDLGPCIPRSEGKLKCNLCSNTCDLNQDELGYCGLHVGKDGRIIHRASNKLGCLNTYLDPIPTNCCMAWTCASCSDLGYPAFKSNPGPEFGSYNYAVFFKGCNFDCLFCQNPGHRIIKKSDFISLDDFIGPIISNSRISCVCYFGGSPEPQLPFSIMATKKVLEKIDDGRRVKFCWEWNGAGNTRLVKKCAELALVSGGNIKFDLKAWTPILHEALCGVDNRQVLINFEVLGNEYYKVRELLPVMGATTLLVPGYVDSSEIEKISEYISAIDEEIPFSLLVFHPAHYMLDLPITPTSEVLKSKKVAESKLKNVHVGNVNLLGMDGFIL